MMPRFSLPLAAVLTFAGLLTVRAQVATGPTSGVYDENAFATNAVDANAGVLTSTTFGTAVATAYAANLGGVINFDGPGFGNNLSGPITGTYGTAGTRGFSIGFSSTGGQLFNIQTSSANIAAISGAATTPTGNYLLPQNASSNPFAVTFTFGALTGAGANEAVTQAGFTLLGRSGNIATTATVTAFFSNGTNSVLTRAYSGSDAATNDTFFGFTAPTGASITSITTSLNSATSRGFDDFGFITSVVAVPEPSTLALPGLCALFASWIMIRRQVRA